MYHMEHQLTELEKTILLSFLAMSRGQAKPIKMEEIAMKFPAVQRHFVRNSIEKLLKMGYLLKHAGGKSYILSEKGIKGAKRALIEGARIV